MILNLLSFVSLSLNDNDPLITEYIVSQINNHAKSTYQAKLNPKFVNMTIGDSKRFLSPIHQFTSRQKISHQVVTNYSEYSNFTHIITGYTNERLRLNDYKFNVYDNNYFCSSWATAVTSAMSLSLSIHSRKFINLSIQYIIDCDIFGDPCIERPGLNAYELFYKRFIPQTSQWDQPENVLRSPPEELTDEICKDVNRCFPNWDKCERNQVLSGSCDVSTFYSECPVYMLNNWKWMENHLWEYGPITSTIFVRQSLFSYLGGVYSSEFADDNNRIIGIMDVTIIGWGQEYEESSGEVQSWWYVIPHLGKDFGETAGSIFTDEERKALGFLDPSQKTGIIRIKKNIDDSGIESQSIGAIPFNFIQKTLRTPKQSTN